MKKLILLLSFLLSSEIALALTCFQPHAGLMAAVFKNGEKLVYRFSASRGYESIPQVEGPTGIQQMPLVKYQLESLKEIGSGFEVQIPLKDCDLSRSAEGLFSCTGQGKIAGTELSFSSLKSFKVKQTHLSGDFESLNFQMMIAKDDTFFFLMPFPLVACTGTL